MSVSDPTKRTNESTDRIELLVPILGLAMFFIILKSSSGALKPGILVLLIVLAFAYGSLVYFISLKLADKKPRPFSWQSIWRAALIVAAVVLGGLLMTAASYFSGGLSQGGTNGWGTLAAIILTIVLGTFGLACEYSLPVDLFPVFRERNVYRISYVLCAAFFLAMVALLWENLTSVISVGIGRLFGEIPSSIQQTMTSLNMDYPLARLVQFLIGAGLLEELLFRVGIMTIVWKWTGHWVWGLLASAICFGFYHISPLSSMQPFNIMNPVTSVLSSFFMGLFMGFIYKKRGFMAVVLLHGLGDWILMLLLATAS
jgi:membrane protease YdiL (CAAX protease family)